MLGEYILCSACGKGNFVAFERCSCCNAPLQNQNVKEEETEETRTTLRIIFKDLLTRKAS